jgi:hypothetical protein
MVSGFFTAGAQYTVVAYVYYLQYDLHVSLLQLHLATLSGHCGRPVKNLQVSCHVGKQNCG